MKVQLRDALDAHEKITKSSWNSPIICLSFISLKSLGTAFVSFNQKMLIHAVTKILKISKVNEWFSASKRLSCLQVDLLGMKQAFVVYFQILEKWTKGKLSSSWMQIPYNSLKMES